MKKIFALLLAAAVLLSMAACAGKADTPAVTTAASGETTLPAGDPNYGDGVLDVNMGFSLESVTPFRNNTGRDQQVMHIMYEQLGVFDNKGNMVPWVAKSWNTEDNGFTYHVEIFDYVEDSAGNKITADDIVWAIEEAMTRALKPCFGKIESVEKTGAYTFDVRMKSNVVGAFEAVLSDTFVVSRKAFEESPNEMADNIVSTSAYVMTSFVPSNSLTLEKRGEYWQKDESLTPAQCRAKVDKLHFTMISEASQMGIALETGKVDVILGMDTTTAVQYVNNNGFVCEQFPSNQGWQLFFSGAESRPVAEDVKLRQAICYAIDADGLVQGLCQGYGSQMWDVCNPTQIGYNKAWEQDDYFGHDLEKAKQLLAESNYNGEELSILCSSSTFVTRLAQMIQAYCGEAGINVKVDSRETAQMVAIRLDGTQYDMFINTIGGTYCADHWSIRYDPNAYATGDGTSRHDYTLGDLLYKTWTVDGYTEENINQVHEYLRDNAIGYGMLLPTVFNVYNARLGITDYVLYTNNGLAVQACTYTSY